MRTDPRPATTPDQPDTSSADAITIGAPQVEHHTHALGIGEARPRISWTIERAPADWRTSEYQLRVSADGRPDETSGWLPGAGQSLVAWPFEALRSRARVHITVRLRSADGRSSAWSPAGYAETGLLEPSDWVARMLTPTGPPEDSELRRPPVVRHEFDLTDRPVSARLYVTAHGLVEPYINGARVGDEVLAPGWTVYPHRLRYSTYDVTELLKAGPNAMGALLGDGWFRGRIGFDGGNRDIYGDRLALLAQLEVQLADGTRQVIATGPEWRAGLGPVLSSGLYEGERYDAGLLVPDWSSAGFDDTVWSGVEVVDRDPATLVAPEGPPIRCTEELAPAVITRTDRGTTLLDFGQNLVGRLRIRVDGPAGALVRLRHAEVLQDGGVYVRPLRGAQSIDEYVLGPGGVQEWEPRFTIHGFRYVEVEGWPGELRRGDVVARVLHTDMRRTGGFSSSDERLNRLHQNVVWSMRGNFVGLPTDCPQRDERLGWTGDIQVFGPTGTFLYDSAGLLSSWLRDLAREQLPDGTVPWFVPTIYGNPMWSPPRPGAAWGDAAVIVPWTLYERYGDVEVLDRQYDSARAWVECVERLAGPDRLWDTGFQLGDWLDPAAPPDDPADARTDRYLVASAYFARSSRLLARMADVVGRSEDAERFDALAREVREAFIHRYVLPDGHLTSDAPTAYALALAFDLLPSELRRPAGERLARLVEDGGDLMATGFVGTPVVLEALSSTGHLDRAYALLMQTACPSWLYMVGQGATTMWERWDSILPDGTVNPGDMTSLNHYAFGAVADWLHGTVAGLRQASPAGDAFEIAPRPGGGLTWAQAWLETRFGRAHVGWELDGRTVTITVAIPIGARATVDLGAAGVVQLTAGHHELTAELDQLTAS
ncbi:family 78 glycoside hydrolase catalytic domain [Cellulomonas sp. McL0617]|uniref:alpha-L-rhamnosidase n=1 Tax=Cellulomonas sp. McL0617 TaxID=3415675 RepID=UPI003CFB5CC0